MKYPTLKASLIFLASVVYASWVCAGPLATPPNDSERNALLALLNAQTAIATKTKLNADYVPGIVTVLQGDDLEARGYRTVWDALAVVPGIDIFLDASGDRRLAIRGVSDTLFSGNVKILLNGVAANSSRDGAADPVLSLPVEQVERIEVVRGPDSAVHGEYAYSGVINVVTRTEGQRAYIATDSDGQRTGGLLLSRGTENGWHWGLNLAAQKGDGGREATGTDALYNTTPSLAADSNAPGPANTARQGDSAIFNVDHDGFSMRAQWSTNSEGDRYGINFILPPPDNHLATRKSYGSLSVGQKLEPADGWKINLTLGWRQNAREQNHTYLGPSQAFGGAGGTPVVMDSAYRESRVDGGMDIHWSGWDRHRVLLGLSHGTVRVDESWQKINLDPSTYLPSSTMYDWSTGISSGIQRRIESLTLQDEFRYSDLFTATTGLRYDRYSDAGNSLTPRIAGVWRIDPRHIVKAQYARAFRPPDFLESRVNGGDILPSTVDTYELGYVVKGGNFETRLNAYYSKLSDLISYSGAITRYINTNHATTRGLEWEQTFSLNADTACDTSIAYTDTRESATGRPIPGATNWLGNIGVTTRLGAGMKGTLQYRYVGKRQREVSDPRGPAPGYQTLDVTVTVEDVGYRGLTLRGGIKNLSNAAIRYPSQMTTDGGGHPIVGYIDDLPGPARTFWLQLSYRF